MEAFRNVLDNCHFQSLHCDGEAQTWVKRRQNEGLIFEKLDRYVSSFEWRMLYPITLFLLGFLSLGPPTIIYAVWFQQWR